jgi:proteasome lid subunit RPN8/RPN11
VSQRIEVRLELPPVEFSRPVLNEICAHALETLPEECCGLLIGDERNPYRLTQHHLRDPKRFPRDGQQGFHMNELDYLQAIERAEARGERVTVVYHSHVDCGLYFSELDQEYAEQELFPFPDVEHLVVSVVNGRVGGLGLFKRDAEGDGFLGRSAVPAAP